MKKYLLLVFAMMAIHVLYAGDEDSLKLMREKYQQFADSINSTLKYETGVITLPNGVAKLNVPKGFKYLNAAQSKFIISDIWGNPPREGIDGMIFPENGDPFSDSSYAFVVTYDAMGFVKDEDADEIDYDDMLKGFQEGEVEENKERVKEGYEPIHMVGWAQKPFYDKDNKVLHWAKELRFGADAAVNTLNYDVRILGRKGVLSLNAVASMGELSIVKKDIDQVMHMATFTEGNAYKDFDPKIDQVAAWTIGGLVAGKVLAKVGVAAFFLKFWKLIALGFVAAGGFIVKLFKRKKNTETEPEPEPISVENTEKPEENNNA
ncbi:DUF2167 domain-containing protein [Paraflavitalea sp. CAU 1676]|uniref:DUF2167 domain-containing protein n=1 Tax=Paraflavitalea sp. CAU 1676 TaxID=3032598 RepID=UPI0023DA5FFC|nr:DUF2167 domain-containing protein [Paraflavitalea sp. CAU 1676]MDF2192200.1 DUF2167 domain-containing protein [Paraflavitalea sp. CAU 1676]